MNEYDKLTDMIKGHEGLSLKPYKCPSGYLTIGYGRNIEHIGITKDEAEYLLEGDINKAVAHASAYEWFYNLNDPRQAAIVDMIFNLGAHGFAGFKKAINALEHRDYNVAAEEILDSRYATQVGRRAMTIARMIKTGEW